MAYVDGFVLPVPKANIDEYRRISTEAGKIWREHGALEYRECVGEDLQVEGMTPFTSRIETKDGETVVFAWILYESREHRDAVNAKVTADPRMAEMNPDNMPFEMARMLYGGFEVLVDV